MLLWQQYVRHLWGIIYIYQYCLSFLLSFCPLVIFPNTNLLCFTPNLLKKIHLCPCRVTSLLIQNLPNKMAWICLYKMKVGVSCNDAPVPQKAHRQMATRNAMLVFSPAGGFSDVAIDLWLMKNPLKSVGIAVCHPFCFCNLHF